MFKKVGIVGTGLIGGSLGLALKEKKLCQQVIGVSRKPESIALAKKIRAIDTGSCDLNIVKDVDLLVLATPPDTLVQQAKILSRIVKPECIVIDVASTKEQIVGKLDKDFALFVGCHPLAGSHQKSIAYARKDLFNNALCIVTPVETTEVLALQTVVTLWRKLGMRVVSMAPDAHDQAMAYTSHMPHALAFCLTNVTPKKYIGLAAGAFKDMTRVAASDPQMWQEIVLSNKGNVLAAIDLLIGELSRVKKNIKQDNRPGLRAYFQKAHQSRGKLFI